LQRDTTETRQDPSAFIQTIDVGGGGAGRGAG
jgi:hypothetical protein